MKLIEHSIWIEMLSISRQIKMKLVAVLIVILVPTSMGSISPVHDLKAKMTAKEIGNGFFANSPYNVLKHLDNSIQKNTKNITQNPQMEQTLYQISKDLVSSILTKLEVQDKITRITREALEAPSKNRGISAIETRRILDYISRTLSGNILSITKDSTEPELHRLVYGLAQIAAEVSIVTALKDNTYSLALSKKQSVDLTLRKKREVEVTPKTSQVPKSISQTPSPVYAVIMNKTMLPPKSTGQYLLDSPFAVLPNIERKPVQVLSGFKSEPSTNGFLNQTVLDMENAQRNNNETEIAPIVLDADLNATHYVVKDTPDSIDVDPTGDDHTDHVIKHDETEIDGIDAEDEKNQKRKFKLEKLEAKAKKAILFAGDVAYLTAASVVAMRRALTASIEVHMSVRFAKNGMANHQDLMMNLARTAAQQAGKEAKIAASKSLACDKVIKLALKYTAQSQGGDLNHAANRIVMDTISLATLAKSMAFVSSDIAINTLYQATDVKPPS